MAPFTATAAATMMKSMAALAAIAGFAFTSVEGADMRTAYEDQSLSRLTRSQIQTHAMHVFMRADRNNDQSLNADEYTALSVVTAELAQLNGFIVIEAGGELATAALPSQTHAALSQSEQIRIEAVARRGFYLFAGDDGLMKVAEFSNAQTSMFDNADFNNNGVLAKRELMTFVQHQAYIPLGA